MTIRTYDDTTHKAEQLGRHIYLTALRDRRGFRQDQLGIDPEDEIWNEIFQAMGEAAVSAPPPETGGDVGEVMRVAQAVVDRWDTPNWKDVEPTAGFINALREALAQFDRLGKGGA